MSSIQIMVATTLLTGDVFSSKYPVAVSRWTVCGCDRGRDCDPCPLVSAIPSPHHHDATVSCNGLRNLKIIGHKSPKQVKE